MINVIIVEDNEIFNKEYCDIVNNIKKELKININIHNFFDYDESFKKIMNSDIPNKIYIFDIEAKSDNGISIASKIRNRDKKSLIIFITSFYHNYKTDMINKMLMYLKYINKKDDYKNILSNTLIKAINEIDQDHIINIEGLESNYYVEVEDILYIYTYERVNYIVTYYDEIPCKSGTIKAFLKILPSYFEQSHRACIVNLKQIININKKDHIIYLRYNKNIDLLSKMHMKRIIEKLKGINNI